MPRCAGFKPNGEQCEHIVGEARAYCYSHDPDRAKERHQHARRGGKATNASLRELKAVKVQLREIADSVMDGTLETGRASVASQALNVLLRALTVERQWYEAVELEERLTVLEVEAKVEREGGRQWG